ncbi:MAG: alpha-ribazole phosphatase [Sediminibacterium sp.]|jgi:alpha-ribazole phosphatase|nr:alpha-ribazole phosphatase [Chitinophagaceae bacterium]MCA6448543.1 alpha-ribazole phosphatase [Chitinophagaceae bacterium]
MEIYLIRHTTPLVEKGICYGQTDLDVTDTFEEEVKSIQPHLPNYIKHVFSSPLQRCSKLAKALYNSHDIQFHPDLMELNCGDWEMQKWDAIPKAEIQPWMDDFVNVTVPNGENYVALYNRVITQFNFITSLHEPSVIVAHGGVLRSILAYITNTPLKESFDVFTLHYGCVVKINYSMDPATYEVLYNVSLQGKEWHRPSY